MRFVVFELLNFKHFIRLARKSLSGPILVAHFLSAGSQESSALSCTKCGKDIRQSLMLYRFVLDFC